MLVLLAFNPSYLAAVDAEDVLTDLLATPIAQLSFIGMQRDAGHVEQGQDLLFEFPFEVSGQGAVTILGVHQECGCLTQSLQAGQKLRAGEKGLFTIQANTSLFVGKFDKVVTLLTDEEGGRAYSFRVKAQIKQTLSIKPPLVEMNFNRTKAPQTAVVRIEGLNKQSLHIKKVAYNEDTFDVEYFPVRDAWEVKITWKGEPPDRSRYESIEIMMDGSVKHLRIPVVGSLGPYSH